MKILLDTNAFLRWTSDAALPAVVESRLLRTDSECFVSIASAWEIIVKAKLERSSEQVENKIVEIGASVLPIRFSHLDQLSQLAYFQDHRDPFDRLLIAQAIAEDLTMISSDMRFAQYAELKLLWD